jgi:phage terminase Nu1 subunit (DNA packaging protein)
MNDEQSLDIKKLLDLGPMAMAKAYQDILKKIKEGVTPTPSELKSLDILEKKLQGPKEAEEETSIVDSMEKVARHFGKSLRQVQRWATQGMPVLSGGRYDLLQVAAWRRLKKGGRGPAVMSDPRSQGQPYLVAEGDKDYWDMRAKKAQAEQRELDLRQRRGELIERQEVEQLFISRIMAVKQGLLSLSRGLPPQLIHCKEEREMEGMIARVVRDLLESFSRPLPESIGGAENGGPEVAQGGGLATC